MAETIPLPILPSQTPEELTGLKLGTPKDVAAGTTAVLKSMQHLWGEMGLLRGTQAMLRMNQADGFDCMSCAWPDPDVHRSSFEFCENGAKALAWEGTRQRCGPEFFQQWSVADLALQSDYWHGQQGRLTHPMLLDHGATHYRPISWDDAFQLIADELNTCATPDEAVFYTSGRASNEAAFLYQLFVREFGTNNLPDCSNMCHESSGAALSSTVGIGKGTVKLEDFEKSQLILIIGQNPGTNHPRMLTTLQEAKRAGARIIAVNPLPEAGLMRFKHPQEVSGILGSGTKLADLFLQVRIGGDMALLKGFCKHLLEAEDKTPGTAFDRTFIAEHTSGFDYYVAALRNVPWVEIVQRSGIDEKSIREAAEWFRTSERIIACWAMGLTQHKQAVGAIQEIVNLILLRGSIGKAGAGLCPVRGHSNVQGDRTMGIWEKPPSAFLDRLQAEFGFNPPRKHGYDTVEAIKAMHEGKVRVFFALGGNFLSATPDTEYTAVALRNCELTVQVSTKLNRSHVNTGKRALILPCLGRTERDLQNKGEQFVTCENSMGVVQMSMGRFEPASDMLLSEPAIVARMAARTLNGRTRVKWEYLVGDYDRIRDHISKVIPGFEYYNVDVRKKGGFYLPNAAREGRFATLTSKANFTVHHIEPESLQPGQLIMMTVRTHDQFNTTVYGLDDRYRGVYNERRVIFLNEEDCREGGWKSGDLVDLTSHFQGETRVARKFIVVPYSIPRHCCATYFPETNVLVPIDSVADQSNTPTSKYIVITLSRSVAG